MHPRVLIGRRGVERHDRAGDDDDARCARPRVQRVELLDHDRRGAALVDVVDAGDDDHDRRPLGPDVAIEPRADLIAALAVHAAIQHAPVGMRRISQ